MSSISGSRAHSSTSSTDSLDQDNDQRNNDVCPPPKDFNYSDVATYYGREVTSGQELTILECAEAGISVDDLHPYIKLSMDYGNALKLQVAETAKTSKINCVRLTGLLAGQAIQLSRKKTMLASNLGIHWRKVNQYNGQPTGEIPVSTRNNQWKEETKAVVIDFLSQDETSRMMPGKKDTVKEGDEYVQIRVLNDYMEVLFERFSAEYPDIRCSRTTFYEFKPDSIKLSSEIKYSNCLCKMHENFGLLLKSAKPYIQNPIPVNPDSFHKKVKTLERLDEVLDDVFEEVSDEDMIAIRQWGATDCTETIKIRGKMTTRTVRRVKCNPSVTTFLKLKKEIRKQYKRFIDHTEKIRNQYLNIQELKNTLKVGEIIVYMDFAENYLLKSSVEAVQSAYWNPNYTTIHPVCVYYRTEEGGELKHQSFAYISKVLSHNTAFAITCIKSLLLAEIPAKLGPDFKITRVHYVSDSPTSQYRNRNIAYFISAHKAIFGFDAAWHYFEVGHGKSVCDGIGGSMKRQADQAVKHGNMTITSPREFYNYFLKMEKNIHPVFISRLEYDTTFQDLLLWQPYLIPVKGTYELHCLFPTGKPGRIAHRNMSCYCTSCRDFRYKRCLVDKERWTTQTFNLKEHLKKKVVLKRFTHSNITACADRCKHLCKCTLRAPDPVETETVVPDDREEESLLTNAEQDPDENGYVGVNNIPNDVIDQAGGYIICVFVKLV